MTWKQFLEQLTIEQALVLEHLGYCVVIKDGKAVRLEDDM